MPTRLHNIAWWVSGALPVLLLFLAVGEILLKWYPDLWLLWIAW